MNTQLSSKEALQILDQAVSQLAVPREAHVKLQEAINVLADATKESEEKTDKK